MPAPFPANANYKFPVICHHQDFEHFCGPACLMMLINYLKDPDNNHPETPEVTSQVFLYQSMEADAQFGAFGMKAAPVPMRNELWKWGAPADEYLIIKSSSSAEAATEALARRIVNSILGRLGPVVVPVNDRNHWVLFYGAETDGDGNLRHIKMRNPVRSGVPPYDPTGPVHDHSPDTDPCARDMHVHERDQDVNWEGLLDLLTPTQWEFDQYYSLALMPKNVPVIAATTGEGFESVKTESVPRKR